MEIMGVDCKPIYESPRAGDIRDSLADISLAKASFGYDPQNTMADGLKKTVMWFQRQRAR